MCSPAVSVPGVESWLGSWAAGVAVRMPFWTSATHRAVSCNWPSLFIAASMFSPQLSKMSARTCTSVAIAQNLFVPE